MTTVFPLSPSNGDTYIPPQTQKILAGDIGPYYKFGSDVGMSSDGITAVIGSYGVAGNQTGAAYVFTFNGFKWEQLQKLTASDGLVNDYFGDAVAISADGSTIAVGAWQEDTGATTDNGAVYIYTYASGSWTQQTKLLASIASSTASFGYSVALSSDGNTLIVGAIGADTDVGAAYVFTRSGVTWTQQQKITPNLTATYFGWSVALSSDGGNTALIGNVGGEVAEVWVRSAGTWTYQTTLNQFTYTGPGSFGGDVSLSSDGNIAVVADSSIDNNNTNYGAVYVYTRSGSTWTNAQALIPTDLGYPSFFGYSVEISTDGSTIAVGQNISANSYGEIHIFKKPSTTWLRTYILSSPDSQNIDQFGENVALSSNGSVVLTGASLEDSLFSTPDALYRYNGAVYTYNFNNIGTRYTYNSSKSRWEVNTSVPKKAPTTHLFTSSVASWTIPTGARIIHAICIGGGGGGGGGGYDTPGGAGGGGGGLSIFTYNLVTGYKTTAVITVGAGGAGGAYGSSISGFVTTYTIGTSGVTGGTSSIKFADSGDAGTLNAYGGTGGGTSPSAASTSATAGGSGGFGMWVGGVGGAGGSGTTSATNAGASATSATLQTSPGGGGGGGGAYATTNTGNGGAGASALTLGTAVGTAISKTDANLTTLGASSYTSFVDTYYPAKTPPAVVSSGGGGNGAPSAVINDNGYNGGIGGLYGGGGGGGGSIATYTITGGLGIGSGGAGGAGAQGCVFLTIWYE